MTKPAGPAVDKTVGYWLLGCGGMVAGMVAVGGLTRLTKSGLSMTEWNLTGRKPPWTHEDWVLEFDRYKTFPEWQQRQSMTLDEFKTIFWWEYGHRQLGRTVGVAFGVPLAYFLFKGRIPAHLKGRMAALFALGGTQGLVGAWMVQSGLDMDPTQRREIRVSPYRLATHLGLAFTTYTLLLWTALDVLQPKQRALAALSSVPPSLMPRLAALRGGSVLTAGLVFTTAMSGAFVAGNDAGRAFNTFPTMDGDWVPPGALELEPLWRNAFENTAAVQFDHRVLALASTSSVAATLALAFQPLKSAVAKAATAAAAGAGAKGAQAIQMLPSASSPSSAAAIWRHLPVVTRGALAGMGGMVVVQVCLGVSTLLLYVPVELAAAHQLGSLVLLSFSTLAAHSLRGVAFSTVPVAVAGIGALSVPVAALCLSASNEAHGISK
eukprot:CAMPEP_0171631544 /NCGR_PEP_ID=MMETSP0990-20121206/23734_1 /TAXON_ID=483369 /ORGANISM="non described non described, Strain CCMP2098" /LENGTH=435 /DNA_ID=CAMNT_0012201217 /DNA_START=89 /DNA_END=1396 /DNA_ORIENTATION=-